MPTPDELRKLADDMERKEKLEELYEAATQNYRDNPEDPVYREPYRELAEKLRAARKEIRESGFSAVPNTPGSVTVGAMTIGRTRPAETQEEVS